MRKLVLATLLMVLSSGTAFALNEPCFDFACDWEEGTCSFDPGCSTATPFIWKVRWNWGDGTGTYLTGPGPREHTFTGRGCFSYVTLTVFPWSNEIESVTCEVIHSNCPFSPPLPGHFASGRCTKDGVDYD